MLSSKIHFKVSQSYFYEVGMFKSYSLFSTESLLCVYSAAQQKEDIPQKGIPQ